MKNNTATIGDAKLYQKIKGFEVRATIGNSNAGYGWRPVCGGLYMGGECYSSERAAITQGKIIVDNLKRRVESGTAVIKRIEPCGACGDGCSDRLVCRLIDESPPVLAKPKKPSKRRKAVVK